MLVLNVAVTPPAAAAMWRTGAAVRRCAEILERPNIVVLVVGKELSGSGVGAVASVGCSLLFGLESWGGSRPRGVDSEP